MVTRDRLRSRSSLYTRRAKMFGIKKEKYKGWLPKLMFLFNVIVWVELPLIRQDLLACLSGLMIITVLMQVTYTDFFKKSKIKKCDWFKGYRGK